MASTPQLSSAQLSSAQLSSAQLRHFSPAKRSERNHVAAEDVHISLQRRFASPDEKMSQRRVLPICGNVYVSSYCACGFSHITARRLCTELREKVKGPPLALVRTTSSASEPAHQAGKHLPHSCTGHRSLTDSRPVVRFRSYSFPRVEHVRNAGKLRQHRVRRSRNRIRDTDAAGSERRDRLEPDRHLRS